MEGMLIPKVQIERAVGPILGMYLADVLTETFRVDSEYSGSFSMICQEFPLKKEFNWQSTNIDYLLYNPDRKQLIFFELKTSDTSVNHEQTRIYREKQKEIKNKGGKFLIEDLEQMLDRSNEQGKYQYLIKEKILRYKSEITRCSDAIIIFLIPESAKNNVKGDADLVLTYKMLAERIKGPFAEEWSVVRKHLLKLDDSSRLSRNSSTQKSTKSKLTRKHLTKLDERWLSRNLNSKYVEIRKTTEKSAHWQGTVKFEEMADLCKKNGDKIIIGFTGGDLAFSKSTLLELKSRRFYRWDYSVNTKGKKMPDWIAGSKIVEILKTK